jgi:hypothetical protein
LNACIEELAKATDEFVFQNETIELVSVDGEVTFALVFPDVALVDRDADQVRHHFREAMIVIPFDPDDFDLALAIGELADLGEELPVVAIQTAEIQVGENVAKKNQAAIGAGFENCKCLSCAADVRAKMYVRKEQRI